jgi:hypothetical protein
MSSEIAVYKPGHLAAGALAGRCSCFCSSCNVQVVETSPAGLLPGKSIVMARAAEACHQCPVSRAAARRWPAATNLRSMPTTASGISSPRAAAACGASLSLRCSASSRRALVWTCLRISHCSVVTPACRLFVAVRASWLSHVVLQKQARRMVPLSAAVAFTRRRS